MPFGSTRPFLLVVSLANLSSLGGVGCSRPPRDIAPAPVSSAAAIASAGSPVEGPAPSPPAPVAPPVPACGDAGDVAVFVSPARPQRGQPLRVVAVSDHLVDAQLTIAPARADAKDAAGAADPVVGADRHGGPPYFWVARVDAPAAGAFTATFARTEACGGASLASKALTVHGSGVPASKPPRTSLWWSRAAWSPSFENLYSAWIQSMFEAPLGEQESYTALHEVLRDRQRNFLYDYLGEAEDEQNVSVRPDCADLPYFLRAYFSFKLGLPFAWSRCTRGENGSAPTCGEFATSSDPFPAPDAGAPPPLPTWADPDRDTPDGGPWEIGVKRLGEFFRGTLADAAGSGAGRTAATDEDTDYYPIVLNAETLRPGTIYGDPYGHVLVVAQRVPQTPAAGGVLFAVDGQPDGTVGRKRFWRGNFLFAVDPSLGSPGFKRFRPLVRDADRKVVRVKNADLPDFSATDQYTGGVEGFYDKMDDLLSPAPLDPTTALLETIDALEEQVKTRVISVENGRRFLASGKPAAEMPDGPKIFETNGDWEDFSTPSRDLRILIAIDVARGLPARVVRRPARYAMPAGKTPQAVEADLGARLARELTARTFEYTRTDGSPWKLSLRDVIDREAALEVAYNPNDCVEQRWGAPPGSTEASTCSAHAPEAQVGKMATYRAWFHDRRRPPR
ncbi:MAG TPA: hypothetical protein VHV30_09950 [Polyangiaceae bacterium]|nr:hypothetical protein [Polyangiaceae bacterium]